MGYVEDVAKLQELIKLEGSPVGVWYADLPPGNAREIQPEVPCQSLQEARYGATIAISGDNSRCIGGSAWLGLIDPPSYVYAFLAEIEKSFADRCAATTFLHTIPQPPTHAAKYVILAPLSQCERMPSLVLFICRPDQAARLLGLHAFRRGAPARLFSYAAACSAAIGIPMRTSELSVSFIDNAARDIARFAPEELIVTVPVADLHTMAESIEGCIWGTAKTLFHAEEEKLKGDWQLPPNR